MYSASAPAFRQMLPALSAILDKAAAWCAERKVEESVLLGTRLTPDMHPLSYQIETVVNMPCSLFARLAGRDAPARIVPEPTVAGMKAALAATLAYVESFKPEEIDGTEDKDIVLKFPNATLNFKGQQYLVNFALPNIYFHLTAAYAILRQAGVPIGKMDFIGKY
jgi:hypothetical protein